jgi:hypothetical protein
MTRKILLAFALGSVAWVTGHAQIMGGVVRQAPAAVDQTAAQGQTPGSASGQSGQQVGGQTGSQTGGNPQPKPGGHKQHGHQHGGKLPAAGS